MFVGIVINLAIWIVGAEILRPNGIEVKTLVIWARRWSAGLQRRTRAMGLQYHFLVAEQCLGDV